MVWHFMMIVKGTVSLRPSPYPESGSQTEKYDKWNSVPHYITEKYGGGPCEPSLTSFYADKSLFSI